MSIVNVTHIAENHDALSPKKLEYYRSNYGASLDLLPDLPLYSDLVKSGTMEKGHSYVVLVPVKYLTSDNQYNRVSELNMTKLMTSIKKANGFSYAHCTTLYAFLRWDGTLVLTQGNHRTIMAWLTQGPDTLVPVNIRVHDIDDHNEVIRIEAENFNTDNNERWNMTQGHRFKGGYIAGDKRYVDLYNFVKPLGISIANTNLGDYTSLKTFESFASLEEALKIDETPNKILIRETLRSLVKHLVEKDINGLAFIGLINFRKRFEYRLDKIAAMNPLQYSFDDFIYYIYRERRHFNGKGKLITQSDITLSTAATKSRPFHASRYVPLFNEYCLDRGLEVNKMGLKGNCAIPDTCDEWKTLLEDATFLSKVMSAQTLST